MYDSRVISKLRNREYRIDRLYRIMTVKEDFEKSGEEIELEEKTGRAAQKVVTFKRNAVQRFLDSIPHPRKIVPKARQLGITTFAAIDSLDGAMFVKNYQAAIIANDSKLVGTLFQNKVKFPYENAANPEIVNFQVAFPHKSLTKTNISFYHNSEIAVLTSGATGRTLNKLHISELGKLDQDYPDRAKALISTSLPALPPNADVTIESTADAGPRGEFHRLCSEAAEMQKAGIHPGPDDFVMVFFGWYLDPNYRIDGSIRPIPVELNEYFEDLEGDYGVRLDDGQKQFYYSKWRTARATVNRQYPSTWEECFMMSQAGIIYSDEMSDLDMNRRIDYIPIRSELMVDTWWDLGIGRSDRCVIVFTQTYPNGTIAIVDYYENSLKGMAHYAKVIKEKNYHYGYHVAPWDIVKQSQGSEGKLISQWRVARNLGIEFQVAPQMKKIDGIEAVRAMFSRFVIDRQRCEDLILRLRNYRYEFDEEKGIFVRDPVHDISSHGADAIRTLGVSHDILIRKRTASKGPKANYGSKMMGALT